MKESINEKNEQFPENDTSVDKLRETPTVRKICQDIAKVLG